MAQCEICGTGMTQGRGRARRTCSAACRQAAHRRRQAEEVAALRTAATAAVRPTTPPEPSRNEPAPPDDSPAGLIRAAGADLAGLIDYAARRASQNWKTEPTPGLTTTLTAEDHATAIRSAAKKVSAAILASALEASRNEPAPGAGPADTGAAPGGSSRDEPAGAAPVPATPAAHAGPSRNDPPVKAPARRRRLTEKAARAVADNARLIRDDRHEGWLLRDDETDTVLGHIEPSYGGTSLSGRNGWTYRVDGSYARTGPYKTRQDAAVQCALSWMRGATAPARR